MEHTITMTIDGTEYVCIPKVEFEQNKPLPEPKRDEKGRVDALEFGRYVIAKDLRSARISVGMTQSALAKKIRKSQTMVALAESGKAKVGERYLRAVFTACKLPDDWKAE